MAPKHTTGVNYLLVPALLLCGVSTFSLFSLLSLSYLRERLIDIIHRGVALLRGICGLYSFAQLVDRS